MTDYTSLQSKTFNFLRFPLMVFIVFIHTINLSDVANNIFVQDIYYLITKVIAALGVPTFFIISGYYFFYTKNENEVFNKNSYFFKLKKRVKTLLIPFLLWNLFMIIFYIVVPLLIPSFGADGQIKTVKQFFVAFVSYNYHTPINYPLWYVRDLMILCILSPIIYLLIKYLKIIPLIILFIVAVWRFYIPMPRMDLTYQSFFYFPLGAYFAIHHKNIIEYCRKLSFYPLIIYIIFIVAFLITKDGTINRIGIIFGLIATYNIVSYFVEHNKLKENPFLSEMSFFLFLFHALPIIIVSNRLKSLLPQTDLGYLINYFLSVFIVVLLAIITYKIMKKYFPRFTSILMGGR